jgi:hypothetical protein
MPKSATARRRGLLDTADVGRLDALAKMLVVGFPICAVVTYLPRRDRLTVDVWSQIDPQSPRAPQMRSGSVRAADCEDLDGYVRKSIGDFLSETGPWFYKR